MEDFRYKMKSTSLISSVIEDIELCLSDNGLTRKILRAEVVENPKNKENTVEIAVVHQRRGNKESSWVDLGGKTLSQLKAGEAAKISLDTTQTKMLLKHLLNLYKIGEEGVRMGTTVLEVANEEEVIKTDVGRARLIRKLLEGNYNQEIWNALADADPDFATQICLSRIYDQRKTVVEEFQTNISKELGEEYWQTLLSNHRWIFGNSYIGMIGERRINIKSTLDHPLITEDGYLEIVEIKKPEFPFWKLKSNKEPFLYRGKYLVSYEELQNAIVQGSNYILEIERELDSKSWTDSHEGINPIKPKCLIVHGRSEGWGKKESEAFRLLNDSLHGITVVTFDHLLTRAKQTLELFNPTIKKGDNK